ncbi:hypothetical protein TIFTF001_035236 [Ficus carica]|uniref:Uncharacterized protein n=1 Tax=Ficus carica TaxID=3494 RepID=A0AA88E228_FICCA|nr:hypothetical protein TIFTF001_035236 [Ficus carica]
MGEGAGPLHGGGGGGGCHCMKWIGGQALHYRQSPFVGSGGRRGFGGWDL